MLQYNFNETQEMQWVSTAKINDVVRIGERRRSGGFVGIFLLQCMKVKSESEVAQSIQLFATPWTAAYQAPPSMGFSRQSTGVGCHCLLRIGSQYSLIW